MSETPGDQPPPYPPPSSEPYGQPPGQQPVQPPVQQPGQQPGQQPPPGTWPQPPPGAWPPPPPTQPYPQPGYGQAAPAYPSYAPPEDKGASTALVLGIVGLASVFVLCGAGLVVSPFALVLGLRSRQRIDASGGQLGGRGSAQAGFIMGLIGTILLVLAIIALIAVVVIVIVAVSTDSSTFNSGTNA